MPFVESQTDNAGSSREMANDTNRVTSIIMVPYVGSSHRLPPSKGVSLRVEGSPNGTCRFATIMPSAALTTSISWMMSKHREPIAIG
jgi:hypothetical protein